MDFMRDHPKLKMDASFTNRRIDILADGFDVAVRMGALPDSTLIARRIAPMRISVAASPNYLAKFTAPKRPRDLTAHDCIIYGVPGVTCGGFEKGSRHLDSRRWPNALRQCRDNCGGGDRRDGHSGSADFRTGGGDRAWGADPAPYLVPNDRAGIVRCPPSRPPPAKTRAFIDALAARFGPEPDWDYLSQASARARTNGSEG